MNDACPREVKRDRIGLFVYYGPCRIRPHRPRRTKFDLGDMVNMVGAMDCFFFDTPEKGVRIYNEDYKYHEVWKRRPKERQLII
jgi:hypothetical protein